MACSRISMGDCKLQVLCVLDLEDLVLVPRRLRVTSESLLGIDD